MDGNHSLKPSAVTCKFCMKHFTSYDELTAHELSHGRKRAEQVAYTGTLRPAFDRSLPVYNSTGTPLDCFQNLVQPFRPSVSTVDVPQVDQGNVASLSGQDGRNNVHTEMRLMGQRAHSEGRGLSQSQTDLRNMVPASSADNRNMIPSSPADVRNMVPSSPVDIRNMIVSSPAEQRNFAASSPGDVLNMVPSSPADGRNLVPHSPAGDQRKLVASSPIDQRNLMVSSPPDPRLIGSSSLIQPDPRTLVTANIGDGRNMAFHNLAEQRNVMASSPVDQRSLPPPSPADQRVLNTSHLEQRNMGSPAMLPHSPADHRPPAVTSSQTDSRDLDQRRIQSIVADIRTLDSHTNDARGFAPPNSTFYRREEGQGFTAVTRPLNSEQDSNLGSLPAVSVDSRMLASNTHPIHSMNSQTVLYNSGPLSYSTSSYLESLTSDLYAHDLPGKSPQLPYAVTQSITSSEALVDNRHSAPHKNDGHLYPKSEPYYSLPKSDYPQPKDKPTEAHGHPGGGHYGNIKILPSPASHPTYQQSYPAHAPPRYDTSKLQGVPPVNYFSQGGMSDQSAKVEQILHNPKQTLHYGQPSQHGPQLSHSQYQDTIPKQDSLIQHTQPAPQHPQIASPIPVHGSVDQLRGYAASPLSTSLAYNQFQKGSNHSQPQIHAPVPSRVLPSQHNFKANTEPFQKASVDIEQGPLTQLTCYICRALFANMNELSEHMKVHAKGMVDQDAMHMQQPVGPAMNAASSSVNSSFKSSLPTQNAEMSSQETVEQSLNNSDIIPSNNSGHTDIPQSKPVHSAEHIQSHLGSEKFECKYCKKSYKSKERRAKHELSHKRDVRLVYCELCEADFEFKANYLYHMQNVHGGKDTHESKVGTKKAVPLTAGSIDRSFESEESDSDRVLNCQICETEVEKDKLLAHLKAHPIFQCDKCKEVFVQKTEYVAHLMSKHRNELDTASDKIRPGTSKVNQNMVEGNKSLLEELKSKMTDAIRGSKQHSGEKESLKPKKKLEKNAVIEKEKVEQVVQGMKIKQIEKKKKHERKSSKGIVYENDESIDATEGKGKPGSVEKIDKKLKFSCSKCEKAFGTKQELSEHAASHVRDPNRFYCEVCNTSYNKQKEKGYYIYHMKYHRDADLVATDLPNNLVCTLCWKPFTKETLVTHIKRDHALYSCDICEWSYSAEKVLVSHMRRIHPKEHKHYVFVKKDYVDMVLEYKPESVAEGQIDKQADKDGEENDPSKTIPCKLCDRRFSKKQYYERHLRSHAALEDAQIHCELCNILFNCKGAYLYHIIHHPKIEIPKERQEFNGVQNDSNSDEKDSKVNQEMESKAEEKVDAEETIENGVSDSLAVNKPKQITETVLNPVTGEFEEIVIEETDDNQNFSCTDEKEPVGVKVERLPQTCEVFCRLCSKSLRKEELLNHVQSHSLFSCDLCEFTFLKKQKLSDHRQALHLEEYIADEIKLFEVIEGTYGIDSAQTESKPGDGEKDTSKRKRGARLLNCSLCNTELKQDRFVDHLKGHIKPVMHCQFCEMEYTKPNLLKMHEKSHERISHAANELPFPKLCPVCNAKIEGREKYVSHLRTHKRKGPFGCKECNKVFTSDKNLENHSKVYHDCSVKVYWKGDGEGLKFDLKTGRISDVVSDHLAEMKEINELLKQNGRPEILHNSTPRKVRERSNSSMNKSQVSKGENEPQNPSTTESEEVTEEEKIRTDTSDEEYVPDDSEESGSRRRSVRQAAKLDKDLNRDNTKDKSEAPRKRRRNTVSLLVSEDSSDGSEVGRKGKLKTTVRGKTNKAKFTVLKKGNRFFQKKAADRVLRSALDRKEPKASLRLKRKLECSPAVGGKRSRKEHKIGSDETDEDFPEKCPVCGTCQFSRRSYEEHSRIHTGESAFKCPVCEQSFSKDFNLKAHMENKHKGYTPKNLRKRNRESLELPAVGKLRTRTRNLKNEDMKPVSSSTPKRSPKLVVRLSPLEVEQKDCKDSKDKASKSKTESEIPQTKEGKFQCEICQKVISKKWNYIQHIQGHKRENKETKNTGNKKEMKKKEKESKPFSCKDCSESFKKKRDLYIHTKVHQTDGNGEEMIVDSLAEQESSVSQVSIESFEKSQSTSEVDCSVNSILEQNSVNDGNNSSSKAETSRNSNARHNRHISIGEKLKVEEETKKSPRNKKRSLPVSESEKSEIPEKRSRIMDEEKKTEILKTESNDVSGINSDFSNVSVEKSDIEPGSSHMKDSIDKSQISEISQVEKGCDETKTNCELQNNNTEENVKYDSSDVEEKKFSKAQLPVMKMSAEKALEKWRAKVQETLKAQLELNAAKKKEMIDNPEIARVKEKLSTKTKSEVRNFECRICGEKFNAETAFRKHMEDHMYESPPYCSICDIYFMAIYPKKRLAEHNRKKHPVTNTCLL